MPFLFLFKLINEKRCIKNECAFNRLNKAEEKILKELSSYCEEGKSTLVKGSVQEMYEDLIDKKEIEVFEKREKQGKVKGTLQNKHNPNYKYK